MFSNVSTVSNNVSKCSALFVLHTGLHDQSPHIRRYETKKGIFFLKWNIEMTIQQQVLTLRVWESIIYVTTREGKALIYKLSRSEALKTQQVASYKHKRKTSELLRWY